jgi:hypothetical protein
MVIDLVICFVDIPTYVQTAMGLPNTLSRRDYPAEILNGSAFPH